jgi:hypothetical protein
MPPLFTSVAIPIIILILILILIFALPPKVHRNHRSASQAPESRRGAGMHGASVWRPRCRLATPCHHVREQVSLLDASAHHIQMSKNMIYFSSIMHIDDFFFQSRNLFY